MKIIAIGDIVGKPGRRALKELMPEILKEEKPDLVIANGENSAGGLGITRETGQEIFSCGVDVITTGNHVWHHKEVENYLISEPKILRPENYPLGSPGRGYCIVETKNRRKVGILNIQGLVFMPSIRCPFRVAQEVVPLLRKETEMIVVDFHAEATSEKIALSYFLSGQVSFVYGTHTHVQTADEQILRGGTAYITDLGMTGPHDSVIGMETSIVIEKFLTQRPKKFEVAHADIILNGAIVEVDDSTGQSTTIRRLRKRLNKD